MNVEQRLHFRDILLKAIKNRRFTPDDFVAAETLLTSKGMEKNECNSILATVTDFVDHCVMLNLKPDPAAVDRILNPTGEMPSQLKVICPLHGIRTLAVWQRELSDLANTYGWQCRLNRWFFGKFSPILFIIPATRRRKIGWLRTQYNAEMNDRQLDREKDQLPSVVAHSFGTYILGYTLLRFDFIRFDRVILCGSILPRDFPWDLIIERGQVQAVRNEYGVRDLWVRRVEGYVRGTGQSGHKVSPGATIDSSRRSSTMTIANTLCVTTC